MPDGAFFVCVGRQGPTGICFFDVVRLLSVAFAKVVVSQQIMMFFLFGMREGRARNCIPSPNLHEDNQGQQNASSCQLQLPNTKPNPFLGMRTREREKTNKMKKEREKQKKKRVTERGKEEMQSKTKMRLVLINAIAEFTMRKRTSKR